MQKIRPLGDRVVVKRLPTEEKIGSLFVPQAAQEKPSRAEVIAVGPGRTLENGQRIEPRVKEKDIVLFMKYSGTETKIDGDEIVVLREEDILGVFEE